jgi:NodT family efflux transporter outer membrane factor (OMF) lipoprotein
MTLRMNRLSPVVLALLFAFGCVSAPPRKAIQSHVAVPDRWAADGAAPGRLADAWWEAFGDAGLDAAVKEALQHNWDLQAAAARIDAAASQARIAGADLRPQAGLGAVGRRQRQNFIGLPIPGPDGDVLSRTFTSLGVSLDVSWEIDLWGRMRAGKRAALADFQAARAEWIGARLSIAGQTAKSWLAVIEARQQVKLAQATVESNRRTAEQVHDRYKRGIRPSLDLRLALSNLSSAEAVVSQRREQADRAIRQLEILLGHYPAGSLTVSEELPGMSAAPPAGLPAELVMRRPDLAAAERRAAAANARVKQARRALYPGFSLTGSGGTASQELRDLTDGDFRVWSLVANIFQPIFQGGRLRAGVKLAKARSKEELARYASMALKAFSEVESALAAESLLNLQEADQQEAMKQAVAAHRLAEDRYRTGLADFVTVLEAQRRQFEAESRYLSVRRLRLSNRVNLYLALGGGFRVEDPKRTELKLKEGEKS